MRWCCGGTESQSQPSTSTAKTHVASHIESGDSQPIELQHTGRFGTAGKKVPTKHSMNSSVRDDGNATLIVTEELGGHVRSLGDLLKKKKKATFTVVKKKSSSSTSSHPDSDTSTPLFTANSAAAEGSGRRGVLKSSLKLLSLRSPNSNKGVQYADEVLAREAMAETIVEDEKEEEEQSADKRGNLHKSRTTHTYHHHYQSTVTSHVMACPTTHIQQSSPCSCCSPSSLQGSQQPQHYKCPHHSGQLEGYGPMLLKAEKLVNISVEINTKFKACVPLQAPAIATFHIPLLVTLKNERGRAAV